MGATVWDFRGWATKNDVKCSDGRTIKRNAFVENDGEIVPLVWNHDHKNPLNVLGHAMLENRPEGVYAYGKFNSSEEGLHAKELVHCGDITSLSIYANGLEHGSGGDVLHGRIREVSLVYTGANPEAKIDHLTICHSDESDSCDEAIIYSGEDIDVLEHADSENKKEDAKMPDKEKTIGEILNSLTDEQEEAMISVLALAIQEKSGKNDDEVKHSHDEGDGTDMKYNAFDTDSEAGKNEEFLSHAEQGEIIGLAKKSNASLRETLEHAYGEGAYGIQARDEGTYGIDMLFPEPKSLNNPPEWIKRDTGWVQKIMSGVHHTPFSRIKSQFADIRDDEARAKGYLKTHKKKEEVFTLLKRTTDPQTIYKKQKLDRDDVIDITSFDIVVWLKMEMRKMLNDEIARAALVGDGRNPASDDKVDASKIIPIWGDDTMFTIPIVVHVSANDTDEAKADKIIKAVKKNFRHYKGSGNPTGYFSGEWTTNFTLIEDAQGRNKYDTTADAAKAMRLKKLVDVEVMENLTRTVALEGGGSETRKLAGIIVNPIDYQFGADKGGAVSMFDDFDIDYNQMIYLMETRCSGMLVKAYSAFSVELVVDAAG